MNGQKQKRGVTLVEIAIVLVIIGLLLGGVLKGQELINNAKVRAIADRQNSLKAAWFAFLDRYSALPGDYVAAKQYIPGAENGEGDGVIDIDESVLVLQHLTGAGYLRCPQCVATEATTPNAANSLINSYGGVMGIFSDSEFYMIKGGHGNQPLLMLHSGPRIPSNIISEVDRKIDDGIANGGGFLFNDWDAGGTSQPGPGCVTDSADTQNGVTLESSLSGDAVFWRYAQASPPIEQNCGASGTI